MKGLILYRKCNVYKNLFIDMIIPFDNKLDLIRAKEIKKMNEEKHILINLKYKIVKAYIKIKKI